MASLVKCFGDVRICGLVKSFQTSSILVLKAYNTRAREL
jgi:hypothetical protein